MKNTLLFALNFYLKYIYLLRFSVREGAGACRSQRDREPGHKGDPSTGSALRHHPTGSEHSWQSWLLPTASSAIPDAARDEPGSPQSARQGGRGWGQESRLQCTREGSVEWMSYLQRATRGIPGTTAGDQRHGPG